VEFLRAEVALACVGEGTSLLVAGSRSLVELLILRVVLWRAIAVCLRSASAAVVKRMHSSEVLDEEVFSVEVVWSTIIVVALIAAPEARAHVLGSDVSGIR
jgi:hypothetical protein